MRSMFSTTCLASIFVISACSAIPTADSVEDPIAAEENVSTETSETCPMIKSENWVAWINAMPGPKGTSGKLIVTGDVTVSTAGQSISLTPGRADRSMKPVQQMILEVLPPDGPAAQVISTTQARYEGPAIAPQYKAIQILCDGEIVAEIDTIEIAH